jgi:hypothetical protein
MYKGLDKWLLPVLRHGKPGDNQKKPRQVLFCMADHFEPFHGGADKVQALSRVKEWADRYVTFMKPYQDKDGNMPRHTFFYPAEEYDADVLEALRPIIDEGGGEVEVQLHHDRDTPENMKEVLLRYRDQLAEKHGFLGRDASGNPGFAFVHGNWALCNARPDGRWCGINNEIGVLKSVGCYVDMTFPSVPSPTQPTLVNCPNYISDIGAPRAADCGIPARIGQAAPPESILSIPGPLGINWYDRKWGMMPRIENGDWTHCYPGTPSRFKNMISISVHIPDCPELILIKMHMHGCSHATVDSYLGDHGAGFFQYLIEVTAGQDDLHFVSAREMYNVVMSFLMNDQTHAGLRRDYFFSACKK